MAKKTLIADNHYNYRVIGIISASRDYRICHYMNKVLDFKFCSNDDISIELKSGSKSFTLKPYVFSPEKSIARYHFINNKLESDILIKKLKEFDYFLIVEGEILKTEWSYLIKNLKQIDIIQHTMELELKHFATIEHLIFEDK